MNGLTTITLAVLLLAPLAGLSAADEPQILWDQAGACIRNLTFENLTLAGKPVRESEVFKMKRVR